MASEKVKQKGLEALESYKEDYIKNELQTKSRYEITLPENQKYFNLYVFSDLYLGSQLNMPKINKLMADIEQAENDPNALVIIGGNIVYYENKKKPSYNVVQKTNMAYALFEPIKDKIVAIVDGPFEDSYSKKEVYPLRSLAKKLGVSDCYFPQGADLVVNLKNEYTDNTIQKVTIYVCGLKTKANTFTGVGNLAEKTVLQHGISDINLFTCVNKSFAPRRAVERDADKEHVHLVPYYIIGNSGYKSFVNLPNNKLVEPNYTGNKIYHVVVGRNLDYDSSSKNTIQKPLFKVYLERHSFGEEVITQQEKDLTEILSRTKAKNKILAKLIKNVVEEALEESQSGLINTINNEKGNIREKRQVSIVIDEAKEKRILEDADDEEVDDADFEDSEEGM